MTDQASHQLTHTEEAVLIAIGAKGATLEEIGRDVSRSAAYLSHVVAKLCRLGYLKGTRQQVLYTRLPPTKETS